MEHRSSFCGGVSRRLTPTKNWQDRLEESAAFFMCEGPAETYGGFGSGAPVNAHFLLPYCLVSRMWFWVTHRSTGKQSD